MAETDDLSNFECGVILSAKCGASNSDTSCHALQYPGFTENDAIDKRNSVQGSSVGKHSLRVVRGEWPDSILANRKATRTQIIAENSGIRKGIFEYIVHQPLKQFWR